MIKKVDLKYCEYCKELFPVWVEGMDSSRNTVSYEPDPWEKEYNDDDSNHWLCVSCHNTFAMEI